jgi:hypothetical protein
MITLEELDEEIRQMLAENPGLSVDDIIDECPGYEESSIIDFVDCWRTVMSEPVPGVTVIRAHQCPGSSRCKARKEKEREICEKT